MSLKPTQENLDKLEKLLKASAFAVDSAQALLDSTWMDRSDKALDVARSIAEYERVFDSLELEEKS